MNENSATELELVSWIEQYLEKNEINNTKISFTGKSEKGEGYVGDIVFASVSGTTKRNDKKTLDFVIKHGKKNDHLRREVPVRRAFENEIYFYDKILPAFKQFQLVKKILDIFKSVPKCYSTLILDNMEVIILDNLKTRGYELYEKTKQFNTFHLNAILKEYGKFHALSFALRDQKSSEFNKITDFGTDVFKGFLNTESVKESIRTGIDKALNILQENEELYLFHKLEKLARKAPDVLLDLLAEKEIQSVILHGDCWNNNFMFKYQNAGGDKTTPSNVVILDWQLSALRSPAFDLSYLIYATSSKTELDKFDDLLKCYYDSFSNFLKELGSNPEELFPYSALISHWKKYSVFGFILVTFALPIILCDKDDAPVFENLQDGEKFGDMLHADVKDKDLYFERVKSIVSHYFE